jgi:glutaredoxin
MNPDSTSMPPIEVVIYSKPGCHLCDVAKKIIESCRSQRDFVLTEVDISLDAAFSAQYGNDVPVIALQGREIARHFVRKDQLLRAVDEAAGVSTNATG